MATIDLKKGVELWKKVKPLLLTKTGVSEKLRTIRDYPGLQNCKPSEAAAWHHALKDVDTHVNSKTSDAKVQKHAKALQWLKDLHKQLEGELKSLQVVSEAHVRAEVLKKKKKTWLEYYDGVRRDLVQLKAGEEGVGQAVARFKNAPGRRRLPPREVTQTLLAFEQQLDVYKQRRRDLKTDWYGKPSRDGDLKSLVDGRDGDLAKLMQAVEDLDEELREDSGGLEKKIRDEITNLRSGGGGPSGGTQPPPQSGPTTPPGDVLQAAGVLGLRWPFSEDDYKKAYRKLALAAHPDKNPGKEKEATERMKALNGARDKIKQHFNWS